MKRLLSIALALILVVAMVGCGKGKRQPIQLTLSTEDAEAILAAAGVRLPDAESAAGANSVVQYFSWGDPFQNYNDDEIVNTGYWTFQEKYGAKIKLVETTYEGHTDDLARYITAGTAPDIMPGGTNATAVFPMFAIKGMIQSCDPWIDYSDPLWAPMADLADSFSIGGKHYQICIQTKPSNVVVYNRRVLNDYGLEDPAQLYWNDEWTWDKFYDMCYDFADIDSDRFAVDGYAYVGMFMESTGQQVLMRHEDGTYYSNIDSPEIERAMQMLYDIKKNDLNYRDPAGNRWAYRNSEFGSGMKEGLCLFYVIGEDFFTDTVENIEQLWGSMTDHEVMFAPLPRDPQGDGIYYHASSFDNIKGAMAIINGATNPEGAALLSACIRFKVVDPTVVKIDERQLQEVYLWTDEMLEMSKECADLASEHFMIDVTGNLPDNLQDTIRRLGGDGIIRNGDEVTWAQLKESNSESVEYYIEELNAMIKDME